MSFSARHPGTRCSNPVSVSKALAGLVVALSGGADSAALLEGLAALGAGGFRGLPLRAVHIDHGLQAAAPRSFRRGVRESLRAVGPSRWS